MTKATEQRRRLISIVIPVFNEEANIERAYEAVVAVFDGINDRYDFEIVFTDNHSTDRSPEMLAALCARDHRVRRARFSRNFGFNRSVLTGYRLARGDAAVQIDCDLQDSPDLIPEFLDLWTKGHDVVVGVRRQREEGRLLQGARRVFYRVLNWISEDNLVVDGGDFRLIDRSILEQLRTIHDAMPYVRGLTSVLAKNQIGVQYDRQSRKYGQSKFPLRRLTGLAMEGIFAHSTVPLRIASYIGIIVAVATGLLSGIYILGRLMFDADWPTGFATTTVLLLFSISLNAIFLGIIGEYLSRIYNQVRRRPTTVIANAVNFDGKSNADEAEQPQAAAEDQFEEPLPPAEAGRG